MEKSKRCYIDIHVLQTVPPSCVNRDDTGSPKTATYGGVTRARVSSQAWKRAVRLAFKDFFKVQQVGWRSKRLYGTIAEFICRIDPAMNIKDAEEKARDFLKLAGVDEDVLFFLSYAQGEAFAKTAMSKDVKDIKAALKKNKDAMLKTPVSKELRGALRDHPAVDMALFGRMVASDPSLNYDAAAQVAHAISTHAVQNEFDYFTAVDDLAPEDNAGAGHIGVVEFNSATLYRYATVNVDELAKLIQNETVDAVKAFVEAFCKSMPTGKQNTFANGTVPDMVYIAVRGDQPVNLAGAFEKPVKTKEEGYAAASEKALAKYAKETYEKFVSAPVLSLGCSRENGLETIAEMMSLPRIIERIGEFVAERVSKAAEE